MNKCGFCLAAQMKYPLLGDFGGHFMDHAVELVRNAHNFIFVQDNIDWTLKVHDMRSDNHNRSVHAVATSLVFDRVPSKQCSCHISQHSLTQSDVRTLVTVSEKENMCTRERYKVFLAHILREFLQACHRLNFQGLSTRSHNLSSCRRDEV